MGEGLALIDRDGDAETEGETDRLGDAETDADGDTLALGVALGLAERDRSKFVITKYEVYE